MDKAKPIITHSICPPGTAPKYSKKNRNNPNGSTLTKEEYTYQKTKEWVEYTYEKDTIAYDNTYVSDKVKYLKRFLCDLSRGMSGTSVTELLVAAEKEIHAAEDQNRLETASQNMLMEAEVRQMTCRCKERYSVINTRIYWLLATLSRYFHYL